jgi:hypothetical protein
MSNYKLTEKEIEKMFGEKIDSTKFTWQRYCGTRGVSVIRIFDNDNDIFNNRFTCDGWCYNHSLIGGLSKPEGIAVMLWDNEGKHLVWCHISMDYLDTLYKTWWLLKRNIIID